MAGYFEQRQRISPTGLTVVIAMHAAALGALALAKGPEFIKPPNIHTIVEFLPLPEDPPEVVPPPPVESLVQPPPVSRIDQPPVEILVPVRPPPVTQGYVPPLPPPTGVIGASGTGAVADIPRLVRVAAIFDPRYAGDQQPPYPGSEERAQREGTVRVRVTIGADGRVKAIARVSATNDAFWRATERHALARWRFRPATEDGRPVESTKVMSVFFRIEA